MEKSISRRELFTHSALAAGASALLAESASPGFAAESNAPHPFQYSFNTSTIRGQELPLDQVVDIAAKAGYAGIEPWVREIEAYRNSGKSLDDLRKRIADAGLTVCSSIGFAEWIVDDPERRKKGLERAKLDMDLVQRIGGTRMAAPPVGAHTRPKPGEPAAQYPQLLDAAERYRALLEVGDSMGVTPQVEMWGFSPTLSRLGEATLVALESGHPQACVLPDIYHFYKGGSSFTGLNLLGAATMHIFHVNDYPASIPRDQVTDADRVYPGDGDAPLAEIFGTLRAIGFCGWLSLELFNRDYWKQDPLAVARTGLLKTKEAVARSLG